MNVDTDVSDNFNIAPDSLPDNSILTLKVFF